jgi:hypothetical protein
LKLILKEINWNSSEVMGKALVIQDLMNHATQRRFVNAENTETLNKLPSAFILVLQYKNYFEFDIRPKESSSFCKITVAAWTSLRKLLYNCSKKIFSRELGTRSAISGYSDGSLSLILRYRSIISNVELHLVEFLLTADR